MESIWQHVFRDARGINSGSSPDDSILVDIGAINLHSAGVPHFFHEFAEQDGDGIRFLARGTSWYPCTEDIAGAPALEERWKRNCLQCGEGFRIAKEPGD